MFFADKEKLFTNTRFLICVKTHFTDHTYQHIKIADKYHVLRKVYDLIFILKVFTMCYAAFVDLKDCNYA